MINRPVQGHLDDKRVTIKSFDIIDKIKERNIDSNYEFRFISNKKIGNEICTKVQNKAKINLKIYNKKEIKWINVNLQMEYKFAGDTDLNDELVEYTYKIISVENK